MCGDSVPGCFWWNYKLNFPALTYSATKEKSQFLRGDGNREESAQGISHLLRKSGAGLCMLFSKHIIQGISSHTLAPGILVISPSLFISQTPKEDISTFSGINEPTSNGASIKLLLLQDRYRPWLLKLQKTVVYRPLLFIYICMWLKYLAKLLLWMTGNAHQQPQTLALDTKQRIGRLKTLRLRHRATIRIFGGGGWGFLCHTVSSRMRSQPAK